MKKEIHPNYREVVFWDTSGDFKFLTRSTVKTNDTTEWTDGKTYPLVKVEISSATHPFFTGSKQQFIQKAGRVERFQKRYSARSKEESTAE